MRDNEEKFEKLQGSFSPEQITALKEVFATSSDLEDLSEQVEKFDVDVDELSDLQREVRDMPEEIREEIERNFERTIEKLEERIEEMKAEIGSEPSQPTTFKEVWQVFLLVIRNKIKSFKTSKA